MRSSSVLLSGIILFSAAVLHGQGLPVPPGVRQADKTEEQIQKNIPPPANAGGNINFEKLRREAEELASLARSIPSDVNQTSKGVLPKDLSDKLKRIEKLAKQIRNGLNP